MFQLATQRLRLEQLTAHHAPLAFRLYSDPRVNKFLGGTPAETIEEERARLETHTQRVWNTHKHGLMAVFLKSDGSFVGICGLLRWEIHGVAETEVAYALIPEAWGNGYATEAAAALADDAFVRLGRKRVISLVLPANTASINVAVKNGMEFERQITLFEKTVNVYAREASISARRS